MTENLVLSPTALRFFRGLDEELSRLQPLFRALGAPWTVVATLEESTGGYREVKEPADQLTDRLIALAESLALRYSSEAANPPQWRQETGCLVQESWATLFGRQRDHLLFVSPGGLEIEVGQDWGANNGPTLNSCRVTSAEEFAELQEFMRCLASTPPLV